MNGAAASRDDFVRDLLRGCFHAGLAAVRPGPATVAALPAPPRGRCVVVGAGKASAAMAAAVDAAWPGIDLSGIVATRHGHGVPAGRVRVVEAGHPVPDGDSVRAAEAMLAAVAGLGPDDLVLALVSGGGSASLAMPAPGISLATKQALTSGLLASGAAIAEINTVRRHISAIKGGRLAAAAAPARIVTLVMSDIPGDDLAAVASGPTLADGSTSAAALAILDRYRIAVSAEVRAHLSAANPYPEPSANGEARLVASPRQALEAAARWAWTQGLEAVVGGDAIEGESCMVGAAMAVEALAVQRKIGPGEARLLLSGGETTVTIGVEGAGTGGRNGELALAMAIGLGGRAGIWALAADTDGIDGAGRAAGAVIDPGTLRRARAGGLDPARALAAHDSHTLFAATGDLVMTGPTLTNVNDFRAVLVAGPSWQPPPAHSAARRYRFADSVASIRVQARSACTSS